MKNQIVRTIAKVVIIAAIFHSVIATTPSVTMVSYQNETGIYHGELERCTA
jgi:hypothetical protein